MKRLPLCAAATAAALLVPTTAQASELTGRLLVTMAPTASDRAQSAALRLADTKRTGGVPRADVVTVEPDAGQSLAAATTLLRARPGVVRVERERRAELRFVPNDPALSGPEQAAGTPAGTPVQWWQAKSNLFSAWDVERGDSAVVAVIDKGVDGSHPELAGKIAGSASFDSTDGSPGTVDNNGHGTHVASLACGAGNNGASIVGAGLNCKILAIKSDLSDTSVTNAINAAVDAGAHAINMSFGTDGTQAPPQMLRDAIDNAVRHNVVLVASAADAPTEEQGDPANVLQPSGTGPDLGSAAIRGLSVTSANFAGQRSGFAGLGSEISMAGYGSFADQGGGPPGLLGAFPAGTTALETSPLFGGEGPCGCRGAFANDTRYAYLQGTSMSAPMIAAVGALMRVANPDLSALEIVRTLKERASRPGGSGWTPQLGFGILNGGGALAAAAEVDRRAPASKLRGTRRIRRARSVTLRWKGGDTPFARTRPSGLAKYEVHRRAGRSRKYKRVLTTSQTKHRFRVRAGQRYRFYTVAVDKAGNREAAPSKPDLTVRVDRRGRR